MKRKFAFKIVFAAAVYLSMLAIICLAAVSCKTTQPLQQKTVEEKTETVSDTVKEVVVISKPILDSVAFYVPAPVTANPDCDSLARVAVANALKSININRQSGDNGYQLRYNELKQQFELLVKIGQTQNSTKTEKKESNSSSKATEIQKIPVIQPLTKEQTFNLWTGRIAWVLLAAFLIKKFTA